MMPRRLHNHDINYFLRKFVFSSASVSRFLQSTLPFYNWPEVQPIIKITRVTLVDYTEVLTLKAC